MMFQPCEKKNYMTLLVKSKNCGCSLSLIEKDNMWSVFNENPSQIIYASQISKTCINRVKTRHVGVDKRVFSQFKRKPGEETQDPWFGNSKASL